MQRKSIVLAAIGVALVLALFYFIFVFGRNVSITNYPPRFGNIVAFGDSLVEGVGATERNDFVSLLEQMIGEPIVTSGVAGDTTDSALTRINEVIEKHPRIVLVLLGGNDYLHRIPRKKTFANLDAIVSKLQEDGAIVVLLGVHGGLLADHFDTQFEKLAKQRHTAYVPNVLDGLLGNPKFMSDEIHPNDAGYRSIATKVYPVLSTVLQ